MSFTKFRQLQAELSALRKQLDKSADSALVELPRNIKKARLAAGMTQEELCEALGVSRGQVANIEAGRSQMTLQKFARLCVALGVGADDLLGLK